MKTFLETVNSEIVLADGAMGTELYVGGANTNKCYDELSLSDPERVKAVHKLYVEAGARLIETNTFTANRFALANFGLEDKVEEINVAAAKLARDSLQPGCFVAGAVGPVSWTKRGERNLNNEEVKAVFAEQIKALAQGCVDVILLETFLHLDELELAFQAARETCQLPVICNVSLKFIGNGEFDGLQPDEVAQVIDSWGADIIGVNCSDGPIGVLEAAKRMSAVTKKPLSVMPNAGLPKAVHGRLIYMATPEYFARYAERFAQVGVKIIGGCCGTTPAHIRKMHQSLKAAKVMQAATIEVGTENKHTIDAQHARRPVPLEERSAWGEKLGKDFLFSVEIEPPASICADKAINGARILKEMGVDAVNIADGPRAMARISATSLALQIREQVGLETITHFCCRDRNLLGMQMDLLGSASLGLNNLMLITGDPPRMGHFPEATAVFDIDAIGLIKGVNNLNHGLDFSGRPIKDQTKFVLGCGVNPAAAELDWEIERLRKKIAAGAEYIFSQPLYDPQLLENFLTKIKDFPNIPFYVGILPLYSLRNAEFLHNEVPGMQVPDNIMKKMVAASSKEKQREVGLAVAREALGAAAKMERINGAYVFPPFRNYQAVEKLLEVVR